MFLIYDKELEEHQIRSVRSRMPIYTQPTEFRIIGYSNKYPNNFYEFKKLSRLVLKDILTKEIVVIEDETDLFKNLQRVIDFDKEVLEQEVSIYTIWNYSPWLFCLNQGVYSTTT